MSITIRLAKIGKRNAPTYRVVVANTKSKRNGVAVEELGFYNPLNNPVLFELDQEKYNDWIKKGALVSPSIKKLIDGKYSFTKYDPKKAKEEAK